METVLGTVWLISTGISMEMRTMEMVCSNQYNDQYTGEDKSSILKY